MATSKSTSKVKLTGDQKDLSKLAAQTALGSDAAQAGTIAPPPGGSAAYIAGTDPSQTLGQESVLSAAGPDGGLSQASTDATNMLHFLSGDVLSPESNPYLKQYGDYLSTDLGNQFATSVLPNIRTGAGQAGQFGSSRQGIAEGLAAEGLARQTGGALADLYSKGYGDSLDAFTKGLGLAPSVGQLALAPGLAQSGVGDVRQAAEQAKLDANQSDYYLSQLSPLYLANQEAGLAAGLPGGKTVSKSTQPDAQSPGTALTALGGAATGASLGATLGKAIPALGAGTGSLGGAGLGALLAFL